MATGENNSRPPCLGFSNPGPLGNVQPSNSAHSGSATNGGSVGPTGGAQSGARRTNPQPGPGGVEGAGVAVGAPPNAHNSNPQAAAQSAAVAATAAGGMATPAINMTTTAASNASASAVAPPTHSALSNAPAAAAAVLVYREPVYNWQATKSTVKERFAFLFNNEVLSDVHFLVGKGMGVQRIPAHR